MPSDAASATSASSNPSPSSGAGRSAARLAGDPSSAHRPAAVRRGLALVRHHLAGMVLACGMVLPWMPSRAADDPDRPTVTVRLVDGTSVTGGLRAVTPAEVVIDSAGSERRVSLEGLRRIDVEGSAANVAPAGGKVTVWCTDGGWLSGDDFALAGDGGTVSAAVLRAGQAWPLPAERVLRVDWSQPPAAGAQPAPPTWQADLPEDADGDLVVVGGDEVTFVPCAVSAVSSTAVTVVLDGETIPVKRAKVLGVAFLRAVPVATEVAAGNVAVAVDGGRMIAKRVEWSPAGLVLDGALQFPSGGLRSIDYAAGRTVDLATLPPERADVEPFFGSLSRLDGMAAFFAPRALIGGGLLVRPRTELVYRIPTGGRRFRSAIVPAVGRPVVGEVQIVVRVDDREVFRGAVSAAGPALTAVPLDIDIAGGRRLTLQVDFAGPADPGFPVRFDSAVIDR
jgi:hypothetical protein